MRGVALLVVSGMAAMVNADVIVTLTPSPSRNSSNPVMVYDPGEDVRVDVGLSQTPGGEDRRVRLIQLDFSSSSRSLSFANNPDVDMNGLSPDFHFDLSSFPLDAGFYFLASELPLPAAAYTSAANTAAGPGVNPTRMFLLPGMGSVHFGFVNVTLPMSPGDYLLDAVTPLYLGDFNLGAVFSWGFGTPTEPIVELRVGHGVLGGTKVLSVIPEPATLLLLACGAIAAGIGWHGQAKRRHVV